MLIQIVSAKQSRVSSSRKSSNIADTLYTHFPLFRQPRGADGGGRQVPQGVSPLLRVPVRAGRQDGHPGQGEPALLQQGLRQVSG